MSQNSGFGDDVETGETSGFAGLVVCYCKNAISNFIFDKILFNRLLRNVLN